MQQERYPPLQTDRERADEVAMLRIDESAKTLVAPDAAELVPDEPPSRDELHALISSGWSAFAAEIGLPHVHAVAPNPAPGIDLLAVDGDDDGRPVIVTVADGHAADHLNGMLAAAATVASWDGDRLGAMHAALKANPSPKMILVGAEFDAGSVTIMDWIAQHGIVIAGYGVEVVRRGSERMMTVVQTYPAPPAAAVAEPEFVATAEPVNSAPPPPPPAPVEAA
jgi:hypothetical protein